MSAKTTYPLPPCVDAPEEFTWVEGHTGYANLVRMRPQLVQCETCAMFDHCRQMLTNEVSHGAPTGIWAGRIIPPDGLEMWRLLYLLPSASRRALAKAIDVSTTAIYHTLRSHLRSGRVVSKLFAADYEVLPEKTDSEYRLRLHVNGVFVSDLTPGQAQEVDELLGPYRRGTLPGWIATGTLDHHEEVTTSEECRQAA